MNKAYTNAQIDVAMLMLPQVAVVEHTATPGVRRKPRRPASRRLRMTEAEREELRRWWLEQSGLSRRELHEIALGLTVPE
jgi:hypothetical protein